MGIGGRLAELDDAKARPARPEAAMGRIDEADHLALADAGVQDARGGMLDHQRHRLGLLHQRQFGGRLDHAALLDHRHGIDQPDRSGRADALGKVERQFGVDGQRARADLAQGVNHQRDRVFVFLPRADLDRNGQIGFERADLEVRADHDRRAAGASSIETRRSLWPQGSPVK
jgi:hypothetical protein